MVVFLIAKTVYIRAWELSQELNAYGVKESERGKFLYETIIFSYEKFKIRS